jgi:predicted DNA-binding transcriptional regulator YafY
MSKREYLLRHRLIISKLRRSPCSFEQIQDFLEIQSEISGDQLVCSLRTFQRDIKEVASLYDIVINYNKSLNAYEIIHEGNEEQNERFLEAFEIFNALKVANQYSNKLLVEKRRPMGTEHLLGLLHAIKNNLEVSFLYEKYFEDNSRTRTVRPIAIKEAKYRWYLLAKDTKDLKVKSFGLDRMSCMELSKIKFDPILDYNPEEEYKHSIGIIGGNGQKPKKVVLSFTPIEAKYIKSLPLHHSQQIILDNEGECRFQYLIHTTYDFIMEILAIGSKVKVLEPKELKTAIVQNLEETLSLYKN